MHCSLNEHLHSFTKPYASCHFKKESCKHVVSNDENCIHDDDESIDHSMQEQGDFHSTERCTYADQQFNYYQIIFLNKFVLLHLFY